MKRNPQHGKNMIKAAFAAILFAAMLLCACGGRDETAGDAPLETQASAPRALISEAEPSPGEPQGETVILEVSPSAAEEEKQVSAPQGTEFDAGWEALLKAGAVKTENGEAFMEAVVPGDYAGDVTQAQLDAGAGQTYESAVLNGDGSVTYRMNKAQRARMLLSLTARNEQFLRDTVASGQYAITAITHNGDFSAFDVTLTTDEVGMEESYFALDLYALGEEFSLYAGREGERYVVRFLGPGGGLLETYDSSQMV